MAVKPFLIKPLPNQVINEGGAIIPLNLSEYIQSPEDSGALSFQAELSDGSALPAGLICTADGILGGIPKDGTAGTYDVVITAQNDAEESLTVPLHLVVKERIEIAKNEFQEIKAQVWEALENNLPLPDISQLLNRPVSPTEVYYLLQQFASLTIWDVYNLYAVSDKVLFNLEGASPHFNVYDRGSCLVATPKDLFSHERTLEDALQTARAMAREVYKRDWVIEFVGFPKMIRAAWVELQRLGDKHGKFLEVLHFTPQEEDYRAYTGLNNLNTPTL